MAVNYSTTWKTVPKEKQVSHSLPILDFLILMMNAGDGMT